jgi:hypothetical protein
MKFAFGVLQQPQLQFGLLLCSYGMWGISSCRKYLAKNPKKIAFESWDWPKAATRLVALQAQNPLLNCIG